MHSSTEPDRSTPLPTGSVVAPAEANERLQRGKVPDSVVEAILDALRGVKFGQITVTVQDGYVVQIERLERRRLRQ
ncbi:MAG: putative small protein [Planctomycetaceae bacterium]|nr:putative small protein [Planctomycetaceae bacterium]